jgi:hypothetical protein
MRKGVTGLQNIQLLKWCREFGTYPVWNFLWGFPGERPEDYHRMAALVPSLTHLPPPIGAGEIHLDRFSPNFDQAESLGFREVTPSPAYRHIYPTLSDEALANLAYYFTARWDGDDRLAEYTAPLLGAIRGWEDAHAESELCFWDMQDRLLVFDLRPVAKTEITMLTGAARTLLLACDQIQPIAKLLALLSAPGEGSDRVEEMEAILGALIESGFIIREGDSCLTLAVPLETPGRQLELHQRLSALGHRVCCGDENIVMVGDFADAMT